MKSFLLQWTAIMSHFARVLGCATLIAGVVDLCSVRAAPSSTNLFHFRTPRETTYRVEEIETQPPGTTARKVEWLTARPQDGSTNFVQLGSRVVLHLKSAHDLKRLLTGSPLELSRNLASNLFILQAPDAWTAAREAHRLAQLPEVLASYPVTKTPVALSGPYAAEPDDEYVFFQWYLEHRNNDGTSAGVDLNVRAAWPYTHGEGITLAIADVGVELAHPELANRAAGGPHFNFVDGTTNAAPALSSAIWAHGTECAGLALAEGNNGIGIAGVAPGAHLASWVIFNTNNLQPASDEQLMDMYQYQSNIVSVQNHSWNSAGPTQHGPGQLEQMGISNAVTQGRFGRGVVMVRSAGNDRAMGANADDDGYPSDPRVIAVGAVRFEGR